MSDSDAHGRRDGVRRIVGLALVVLSLGWIVFGTLFGLGLVIAWISETGFTDELQSRVIGLLIAGALSIVLGYGAFVVGRHLRRGR